MWGGVLLVGSGQAVCKVPFSRVNRDRCQMTKDLLKVGCGLRMCHVHSCRTSRSSGFQKVSFCWLSCYLRVSSG